MARSQKNAVLVACVAAAAGLLFGGAWWLRSGEVALPVSSSAALLSGETSDASTGIAGTTDRVGEPDRIVQPDTRVTGIVCDCDGRLLPGVAVVLQRLGVRAVPDRGRGPEAKREISYPPAAATTDARGEFCFPGLEPADYEVWAKAHAGPTLQFPLAIGESRRCELRLTSPTVTVAGIVRFSGPRGGLVQVAIKGQHRDGEIDRVASLDANGEWQFVVPPGSHTVQVQRWLDRGRGLTSWVVVAGPRLLTAPAGHVVRCDFDMPATQLTVQVEGGPPAGIAGLEIQAVGTCPGNAEPIEFVQRPQFSRKAAFTDLPCGEWRVSASAAEIVETITQMVSLTVANPHARVLLTAQEAGRVRLSLLGQDGRQLALYAGALPVLVANGREFACGGGSQFLDLQQFAVEGGLTFLGVPLGRAELLLEDRTVGDLRQFLPFDPRPRVVLDIVPGDNLIELQVELRPLVRLFAVGQDGFEDPRARVSVLAGERQARDCDTRVQHWLGYLPPGEYRAVVERGSVRKEQSFTVANGNLELQLRP